MKGFTKIALSIALIAILVLSIVVASVAWFTSNPEVDANDVTLNAKRTSPLDFDSEIDGSDYRYNGQTGRAASGANAPYVYEAGSFTAMIRPSSSAKGGVVKLAFGTVSMEYGRDSTSVISGSISNILITDLFTVQVNCYSKSNTPNPADPDDNYIKDDGIYQKDDGTHSGEQHYKRATYTMSDDGYVMDGNDIAVFPQGDYGFSFTYIFLPTEMYAHWTAAEYTSIYGYEYSSLGNYCGVIDYVEYDELYHSSITPRYDIVDGHGVESTTGAYVKVISSYELNSAVTRYTREGDVYTVNNTSGTYVRIGTSDDYVLYSSLTHYNRKEGFPYYEPKYMDAKYTFTVSCAVEEVEAE